MHPTHNFAIVQYDPKLLGDTDVMSAPFSDKTLSQGHKVTLVAHNHNQRPVCLNTVVTDVTCVTIPHNGVSVFFLWNNHFQISFHFRKYSLFFLF